MSLKRNPLTQAQRHQIERGEEPTPKAKKANPNKWFKAPLEAGGPLKRMHKKYWELGPGGIARPKEAWYKRELDRKHGAETRAQGECLATGRFITCSEVLQNCHLITRANRALFIHPLNTVCLCQAHQRWFHQHPARWTFFIEELFPGRWQELFSISNDPKPVRYRDLYERMIGGELG